MIQPVAIIEIAYATVAFLCGITILFRDPNYLGNRFFGIGYIIYGIPGLLLFISNIIPPNPSFIILSVRSMVFCTMWGISFLFLGSRVYFRGTKQMHANLISVVLGGTLIISVITQLIPSAVEIISLDPVDSKVNIVVGALIFIWHFLFCTLSMNHLFQVRKSESSSNDKSVYHKINLFLVGFILSIAAVIAYAIGDFGENRLGDLLMFSFALLDLLFIWRGLTD